MYFPKACEQNLPNKKFTSLQIKLSFLPWEVDWTLLNTDQGKGALLVLVSHNQDHLDYS